MLHLSHAPFPLCWFRGAFLCVGFGLLFSVLVLVHSDRTHNDSGSGSLFSSQFRCPLRVPLHKVGVHRNEAVVGQPCKRVRLHDVSYSHHCDGAEHSETVVSRACISLFSCNLRCLERFSFHRVSDERIEAVFGHAHRRARLQSN